MKSKILILTVILFAVVAAGVYLWYEFRGVTPAFLPPIGDIANELPASTPEDTQTPNQDLDNPTPAENQTNIPLSLPDNFRISIFAKDLAGARVMAIDGLGNMWVSQTAHGTVSLLEIGDNGIVTNQSVVFKNLRRPHGLAIDPQDGFLLYIAEEDKISRARLYSEGGLEKIIDLPPGDRHYTRTVGFGPDDRLYVSIGSTCDVCYESDPRHAAIYSMNRDGTDFRSYATGLRNSVFFRWSFVDGSMWATEMGRDHLGDNLPPDEINVIAGPSTGSTNSPQASSGQNPAVPDFGWPVCYGNNVHDTNFDKNVYIQNPCNDKIPAKVELQAHSAPLGLDFVPEGPPSHEATDGHAGWPEDYWYDLIVAYHGSWNRSVPTGYKLVRVKLDAQGNVQGLEDFITGWLTTDNRSLGRPVDVLIRPGGVMYVTDDSAGVVYRVTRI